MVAEDRPLQWSDVLTEEIRFAAVMNGGVSLAVWMGGAAHELNRLTRSSPRPEEPGSVAKDYRTVLAAARSTAIVDVLAGTSAGGINAGALALAQVNAAADLSILRSLWAEQGRLQSLLRKPFQGDPASLLRGDDYFLPELNRAMRSLITPFRGTDRRVDLIMPTTLLKPTAHTIADDLGQPLHQQLHGGSFRFPLHFRDAGPRPAPGAGRIGGSRRDVRDRAEEVAAAIALASRASAGFPFAFEPTFVPVDEAGDRPDTDLRPDMGRWASWKDRRAGVRSRYAVDGGLIANTPTEFALTVIEQRPVSTPVRRVMLLVFPHASQESVEIRQRQDDPPTVKDGALDMFEALRSQGSRTFVEDVQRHNEEVDAWLGGRLDVLPSPPRDDGSHAAGVAGVGGLYELVYHGWPAYRRLRMRRFASTLAGRVIDPGWSFERIREQADLAQQHMEAREGGLPYIPEAAPPDPRALWPGLEAPAATPRSGGGRRLRDCLWSRASDPSQAPMEPPTEWRWVPVVAEGVADAVVDVLGRALAVSTDAEGGVLGAARAAVSEERDFLDAVVDDLDHRWEAVEALGLPPDRTYFEARFIALRRALRRPSDLQDRVDEERLDQLAIPEPLHRQILERRGGHGARMAASVWRTVAALADPGVLEVVQRIGRSARGPAVDLDKWLTLLDLDTGVDEEPPDRTARLFMRLLALDAATWLVASTASSGTNIPIGLVQLSLDVPHAFARISTEPRDKAAGLRLGHFGGFLKRSWRLNDWVWGRLDATTILCRIVLDPKRLRRIAALVQAEPADLAARLMRTLEAGYGGDGFDAALHAAAEQELVDLFAGTSETPSVLPNVAEFAAIPLQWRIVLEELPYLAAAVAADGSEGQNPRSRSALFVLQNERLLQDILRDGADDSRWRDLGRRALAAFDEAGIGREQLADEAGSDALIETSATAAAVAVTLLDSNRFGVGAIRPVTRSLRGAALLPYWLLHGLTRGTRIARILALTGFAAGAVLLTLGLLGAVGGFSSPAALAGVGILLAAFAYAALRTGALLHGVAMLGPVIPLLAFVVQWRSDGGDAAQALVTVGVVLALALGLAVLGSLPWPLRSPVSTAGLGLRSAGRRLVRDAHIAATLARYLPRWFWARPWITVALVAAVAVVGYFATRGRGLVRADWIADHPEVVATASTFTVIAAGAILAWRRGAAMRRWTVDPESPRRVRVNDPAGVASGWAAVYGSIYLALGLAVALTIDTPVSVCAVGSTDVDPDGCTAVVVASSAAWAALLGLVLLLVAPSFVTWRARRRLEERLLAEPMGQDPGDVGALTQMLRKRDQLYVYLVAGFGPLPPATDDPAVTTGRPARFTARGRMLQQRMQQAHRDRLVSPGAPDAGPPR